MGEILKYFEASGREKVDETLDLAKKRASELDIEDIVLASTRGFTAEKAFEVFDDDYILTVVGIGRGRFDRTLRGKLEGRGHNICFSEKVEYDYPDPVVSAYRRFCEGVKVAVEIAIIAAEEGFVSPDEEVVSVGKWDTAMVIKPAKSKGFSDLRVKELICKPR